MIKDDAPVFVIVPKGYTVEQASQAIILCRRMGMLKEQTHGWLLIPEEATRLFSGHDQG